MANGMIKKQWNLEPVFKVKCQNKKQKVSEPEDVRIFKKWKTSEPEDVRIFKKWRKKTLEPKNVKMLRIQKIPEHDTCQRLNKLKIPKFYYSRAIK